VAYRLLTADTARRQVRVRSLRDGGASTVATGDVSAPVWQADRQHVFFTASMPAPAGAVTRVFRFAVNDGTHVLTPAAGMAAGPDVQVRQLSPSPDGHQLAFLGDDALGRPGVWTMNVDGTGVARLTDADLARFPYSSRDVAWTPS
jgi:Tol biopolymer transport system component